MNRSHLLMTFLAGLVVLAVPVISSAQSAPSAPARTAQNVDAQPPAYRPGLGGLMTMTVQPRHIKLALAGREHNWTYAAYELHELEEAF